MHKFIAANRKEGDDLIKSSLIFSRTINPASINVHNPVEAKSRSSGLKYKPSNNPKAPTI